MGKKQEKKKDTALLEKNSASHDLSADRQEAIQKKLDLAYKGTMTVIGIATLLSPLYFPPLLYIGGVAMLALKAIHYYDERSGNVVSHWMAKHSKAHRHNHSSAEGGATARLRTHGNHDRLISVHEELMCQEVRGDSQVLLSMNRNTLFARRSGSLPHHLREASSASLLQAVQPAVDTECVTSVRMARA